MTTSAAAAPARPRHLRTRRFAAGAVLAAGLSIPVTGAGSAVGHVDQVPNRALVTAVTSALVPPVAMGKLDV